MAQANDAIWLAHHVINSNGLNTWEVWAHSFCLNSGTNTSTNIITFVRDNVRGRIACRPCLSQPRRKSLRCRHDHFLKAPSWKAKDWHIGATYYRPKRYLLCPRFKMAMLQPGLYRELAATDLVMLPEPSRLWVLSRERIGRRGIKTLVHCTRRADVYVELSPE